MRNQKPRIGLDVDGVLADLTTPFLERASQVLNREVTADELKEWDFNIILPAAEREAFWKEMGSPGVCRNLKPSPGAIEGVRRLCEIADVYIITSHLKNSPTWVHERDQWLEEHFAIPHKKIIHTHSKHIFSGYMLVDDKPAHIEEWAQENMYRPLLPVLWLHPYNEKHRFSPNIEHIVARTNSWDELIHWINTQRKI